MKTKVDGPGELDRYGNKLGRTMRYSFGVSRSQMKKIFVDEIKREGVLSPQPGPDKYTMSPSLGPDSKSGLRYSMMPKSQYFDK